MSIRQILKNRIAELTKEGIKYAATDQPRAMELLIRLEEAKYILNEINKNR